MEDDSVLDAVVCAVSLPWLVVDVIEVRVEVIGEVNVEIVVEVVSRSLLETIVVL